MRLWGFCPGGPIKPAAVTAVAMLAAAACWSDPMEPPGGTAFVVQAVAGGSGLPIMTQNGVQNPVMDACFQGRIIPDDDGCIRLADEEGPTVVWPVGYTGEISGGETRVLDHNGNVWGQVGSSFAFGGGAVPELRETLGFSQQDRDLAERLCPGRYWTVAS